MKSERQIACLPASDSAALDAAALPSELRLLRWGRNETTQGVFIVNDRTVDGIRKQISGGVFDRVLLDFQHNSERGHPNYQPPPRHHAAVGVPFCEPGSELGINSLAWTPYGKQYALDYPDQSPAVLFDKQTREVIGLRSAALCPQGATVNGIAFFSADDSSSAQPEREDHTMPEENTALTAQIAALVARIEALEKAVKPATETATAAMSATDKLRTEFASLSAEGVRLRKAAVLDQARREGKVVSLTDSAVASLSEVDLAEHVKTLRPGRVPLTAQTQTGAVASAALDADTVMAQYNAISDPAERSRYFSAHRAEMGL